MRTGYRTADFHRCSTDRDRLYYSAGIPSACWNPPPTDFSGLRFKTFSLEGEAPVVSRAQREWFDRMVKGEFFSLPYLMIISADIDDYKSTGLGFDLMKLALAKGERIHVTEAANVHSEKNETPRHEESVRMLVNVYDDSPPERIQLARDWAYSNEACFRVLCTSGDPGQLIKRLRLRFNAAFYVESKTIIEKDMA